MTTTSESIKNIAAALLQVQGTIGGVKRDSTNPHFKSKYASLEAVIDTARPALQAAGVVFLQSPGAMANGTLEVTTTLIHAQSGEWISGTMQIPLGKQDPQGAGSALTYSQRYSLMAMLGLPPTDDDGEGAMDRHNERPAPAPRSAPAKPAPERPADSAATLVIENERELQRSMDACQDPDALADLWVSPGFQSVLKSLPKDRRENLLHYKDKRKVELNQKLDGEHLINGATQERQPA